MTCGNQYLHDNRKRADRPVVSFAWRAVGQFCRNIQIIFDLRLSATPDQLKLAHMKRRFVRKAADRAEHGRKFVQNGVRVSETCYEMYKTGDEARAGQGARDVPH